MIHDIVHHTSRSSKSIGWLTEKLQCSERELRRAISNGQKEGYIVRISGKDVFTKLSVGPGPTVSIGEATPGRHHIGHFTDMHWGSKHSDLKAQHKFLSFLWKKGVRSLAITGDCTDGVKALLVPDQRFTGADEQLDEGVKVMKEFGFACAAITGNHDGYTSHAIGFDFGKLMEDRMRAAGVNWNHAGTCRGNAVIEGARTHLYHPMGAASTPNSIRTMLNRHAERLEEPCDCILSGHLHHYASCYAWREKIYCASGGTFQQKRSEFANRISGPWDFGGSIISFSVDSKGRASEFSSQLYPSAQFA